MYFKIYNIIADQAIKVGQVGKATYKIMLLITRIQQLDRVSKTYFQELAHQRRRRELYLQQQ